MTQHIVFFLSLSLSAHYIILLVESVLFGVFVMVIFYDQVVIYFADLYNETVSAVTVLYKVIK